MCYKPPKQETRGEGRGTSQAEHFPATRPSLLPVIRYNRYYQTAKLPEFA